MSSQVQSELGRSYELEHRYTAGRIPALLTGTQAVARLLIEQHLRDRSAGIRSAAFVSGYPGSPLGGLDRTLAQVRTLVDCDVKLAPAVNEELAATAVWGSQQQLPGRGSSVDGVVGIWYGKSPGLDRAGDPLRHGNLMGAHPNGGALVLVGDDPGAKSSTLPCASERTLAALGMPVLFPRDSEEIITLGLYGIALSRASGCWVGMKITADVADGFSCLRFDPAELAIVVPTITWNGAPWSYTPGSVPAPPANLAAERELVGPRAVIVEAFAAQNLLNVQTPTPTGATTGIVAAGKAYDDVDQALLNLGLDRGGRERHGLRMLRLGLITPVVESQISSFAAGLETIVVIEEKAAFIEAQIRDRLYGYPNAPAVLGKRDAAGALLVPADGEITADRLAEPLRRVLEGRFPVAPARVSAPSVAPLPIARTPYFCSGCPHNRSTVVPEGSLSSGGIGCHAMVALIPRPSSAVIGLTQMGGEGAQWIGQATFWDAPHIFQNMGDGTFFHSGQLAVQACIAAGVSITYKILYNSAIAMTGGQDPEGALPVPAMARKLMAEGVRRIIVCADEPEHYPRNTAWPTGVELWHRDRLDEAQQALRDTSGVTVLIYDQQCAAEARRLRRRGIQPARAKRVVINEAVCEGCGDCGVKSNCLSVQPVETEFGTKTRIDQASCNTDYTCIDGDCPAFVTVDAPTQQLTRRAEPLAAPDIPPPGPAAVDGTINVLLVGVGGTGVVTVNQVLATAALLDGREVKGVDQTGLSQKAGPVTSHLRFGSTSLEPAGRVSAGQVDCLLALDLLAAADSTLLAYTSKDRTQAFTSTARTPTGRMIFNRSIAHPEEASLLERLHGTCRNVFGIDATAATAVLAGNPVAANFMLVGAAVQAGALPLQPESVERAIEMNGVAVDANRAAFRWGRVAVARPSVFEESADPRPPAAPLAAAASGHGRRHSGVLAGETARLAEIRASQLVAYQSRGLARRYLDVVESAWLAERGVGSDTRFSEAVARSAHHLMAYKDEYEVARLLLDSSFEDHIQQQVPGAKRVRFQLHPPMLRALGLKHKIGLGAGGKLGLRVLARSRRLRGTPLDIFGYSRMRRLERRLVEEYVGLIRRVTSPLSADNYEWAVEVATAPLMILGFETVKLANIERYREELQRLGVTETTLGSAEQSPTFHYNSGG